MNANQELYRNITSILVLFSLPPLLLLINQLILDCLNGSMLNLTRTVLLMVYVLFLFTGLITLYINIQFVFFNAQLSTYNELALLRNLMKQVGILTISWMLLYISHEKQ